jgi:hypothetical protein
VSQLLAQVRDLLARLESGPGLPAAAHRSADDGAAMAADVGVVAPPPVNALPWLLRVEPVVFGQWQTVTDGQVHCPYCGADQIGRKSAKPRWKKYYDAAGPLQHVAVHRYCCRNPQCAKGSFTHLPPAAGRLLTLPDGDPPAGAPNVSLGLPSCWRCAARAITHRWSSPTYARTTAR